MIILTNNVIRFTHSILENVITKDDIVVDATVGNGHDTLFLSTLAKSVIGFDVQELAIKNTKELIKKHDRDNVKLYLSGHEDIAEFVQEDVKAVTFNLGYLPGSDKTITTHTDTTIKAIASSIDLLSVGGVITIIAYIGHHGGLDESNRVLTYVKHLDKQHFQVIKYQFLNMNNAPFAIIIEKTR